MRAAKRAGALDTAGGGGTSDALTHLRHDPLHGALRERRYRERRIGAPRGSRQERPVENVQPVVSENAPERVAHAA